MSRFEEHKHSILAEEERDIYIGVINRFIGYYSREAQKETQNDTTREYPFVAMDTRQVFEQIHIVHEQLGKDTPPGKNHTFLDVGCGIGNIMLIAEQYSFDAYGIEKDEYPYQLATRLIDEEHVWQKDIWEFDGYHTFDVIYYFRPLPDAGPQTKFELMIEEKIKKSGILIANRKISSAIEEDSRFKRLSLDHPIWQKVSE
ncbi:MAG: class I SAM-dependent methyltransferase [Desulfobulbaceae bacterium]|uniref:Class I SAM-dependent methyltransferase n=1 Tax=Candidatus Desulfobia pelagia TaxID=2841692 RepID=A0A8J6TGR5_9BACT|nr:class I SAM-dependent methyltransferase [Candidatus Desulfobia pelagia]